MKRDFNFIKRDRFAEFKKLFDFRQTISPVICLYLWLIILCISVAAQETIAPGAPGKDAQWASAGKQGIGTAANLESKVWFTLEGGALTEVYYPDVTVANVHKLEFVVVNPKTKKVETETEDAIHDVKVTRPDSLTFHQINTAKSGEWKITKTYTTDVERDSILIDVQFETKNKSLNLYVYYDPSLGNSGMGDSAKRQFGTDDVQGKLTVEQRNPNIASALKFSSDLSEETNGFYQVNDGLEQLRQYGKITKQYNEADNGNVVQMARIVNPSKFTTVLSFAETSLKAFVNAVASSNKGFARCRAEYEKGWSEYVRTLPKVAPKYQAQFNMAAMELKAHEDKTKRGANIASLTVPWGGGDNANENTVGGYHLVWSRDLYQVATAYMALGDTAAANRALDFVFNVQQKPDGSFPQNSKLDGTPFWGSLQLDEVAFPMILAYQLKRFDKSTWENHVKKAADFIVKIGPKTPQERWEEKSGYSPSTIAAEIAGLVCAAEIARKNGDDTSANLYLKTADDWQANIEKWTATTNGKYGDGNYYVRLTENGTPDAKEKTILNNNAGNYIENEIVDAGFLELVRLGIKSPDDPLIVKSLKVIDEQIKINTPNGEAFYRYNHDGYGEMDDGRRWNFDGKYTGKGRLWALLSGERGQYELAAANAKCKVRNAKCPELLSAEKRLDAMLGFANDGLMIPEQIWDKSETPPNIDKQFIPELKFGEGTGSATPLAWSMAQFIRLAVNLQAGKNLETPDVVYNRYVLGKKAEVSNQKSDGGISSSECQAAEKFRIKGNESTATSRPDQQSPHLLPSKGEKDSEIIFSYVGAEKSVEIVGDFTGWKPCNLKFQDLENSKSLALKFPNSARVEYKFIVDGKWINDPLNPNRVDNGIGGENSFFAMPDYQPTTWDKDINISTFGRISDLEINSKIYGKRTVKVYQPIVTGNERNPLPTLYLQDGTYYMNRADAIQIQQNLVQAQKFRHFIMVFLDPKDRMKEYWANDDYAKFLATEVVPAVDAKYHTIRSRDGRAILGASLGGITSIHTALKYPNVFSRVGGQSASWWIDDERVVKDLQMLNPAKNSFKFYFDTGTLEGAEDDRRAVAILRKAGYAVNYEERETGHNWTSWRDRLADAFIALWKS